MNFTDAANTRWIFTFFRKTAEPDEIISAERSEIVEEDFARIRCPACGWQPDRSSQWVCYDPDHIEPPSGGCMTWWNTFDTRGVCPGCNHQWQRTQCLSCGAMSFHEDWYEKF